MKIDTKTKLIFVLLLLVDQVSKLWARRDLAQLETIPLIDSFFHLTYVENRGAAFGMLQGKSMFFALATIFAIALIVLYYRDQQRREASHEKLLALITTALVAGAIGNLIDRSLFGFVTDFFDFRGIWKFVFNVADIYVVCGTIMLSFYVMKYDTED